MSLGVETGWAELTARLVNAEDRQRFAQLVTYAHALPNGDEFRQLMELLGLLSLLGQRIPEAAGELLVKLRELSDASQLQTERVETRLAGLPAEVLAGVDASAIAAAVSESLRQNVTKLGLQEAVQVLESASKTLAGLASDVSGTLAPVARQIRTVTASVTTEVAKLDTAARQLQQASEQLAARGQISKGIVQVWLALILFVAGGLTGMFLWERQHSLGGTASSFIQSARKGIQTK